MLLFYEVYHIAITQSHTSSSEFIFKPLPGDTVVKLLGKKMKLIYDFKNFWQINSLCDISTLFSDIFLSYLFDSISLYFTFTLSVPVIMQLPINCKHATVLANHHVLSLH